MAPRAAPFVSALALTCLLRSSLVTADYAAHCKKGGCSGRRIYHAFHALLSDARALHTTTSPTHHPCTQMATWAIGRHGSVLVLSEGRLGTKRALS